MDDKETALLRRLATACGAGDSKRLSDELMELRFQRVIKLAIIDEFMALHAVGPHYQHGREKWVKVLTLQSRADTIGQN